MDKVHGCVQFCIDNVFQTIEFLKLSCDKQALLICEYGEYTHCLSFSTFTKIMHQEYFQRGSCYNCAVKIKCALRNLDLFDWV